MGISSFPGTADAVIGDNDLVYENTWDKVAVDIYNALDVEHTASTGAHDAYTSMGGLCLMETDTFTGDGETTQVISLNDSNLIPLFIRIWEEASTEVWISTALDDHPTLDYWYVWREAVCTSVVDYLYDLSTQGQFTVYSNLNVSSRVYYYTVYGIPAVLTGNGNSFTPSWVQHNDRIILDTNSDGCSTRAVKEILARYQKDHYNTGVHKNSAFTGLLKIAIGTYTGNANADGPLVTLPFSTVKYVLIWGNGNTITVKTANMTDDDAVVLGGSGAVWNDFIHFEDSSFQIVTTNSAVNTLDMTYYYLTFMA